MQPHPTLYPSPIGPVLPKFSDIGRKRLLAAIRRSGKRYAARLAEREAARAPAFAEAVLKEAAA